MHRGVARITRPNAVRRGSVALAHMSNEGASSGFSATALRGAGRGVVDHRLARRHLINEFRRGRLRQDQVCDAHPELIRAARNIGSESRTTCPICGQVKLRLVTYVFGSRLPSHGLAAEPGSASYWRHERFGTPDEQPPAQEPFRPTSPSWRRLYAALSDRSLSPHIAAAAGAASPSVPRFRNPPRRPPP